MSLGTLSWCGLSFGSVPFARRRPGARGSARSLRCSLQSGHRARSKRCIAWSGASPFWRTPTGG
eukprot:3909132-Amphidinium_carterae.1